MGACAFAERVVAKDASTGFRMLYDRALAMYGDDPYNGTISTCSFTGRVKTISKVADKDAIERAGKFIEDEDYGSKGYARAVDCGVYDYKVTKVTKKARTQEKPVFGMRYVVIEVDEEKGTEKIPKNGIFTKKGEADSRAVELILSNTYSGKSYYVAKRQVILNGASDVVTDFEVDSTRVKEKPKNTKGKLVEEEHLFIFYGWACE